MNTTPRLLVTGASGFVGEHVARHFAAKGWDVLALGGRKLPILQGPRTQTIDIADFDAISSLLSREDPDFVFHGAGVTNVRSCEEDPEGSHHLNVEATAHLLRASKATFLFCSTDLVFDGEEAPYHEGATPKPLHHYGSQKWAAERVVLSDPRGVVLRLPLVLGAPVHFGTSALSWMVNTLVDDRELTLFHDEWRTPVWVGDIPRAVEAIFSPTDPGRPSGNVYHAAGGERFTRVEIGHLVCGAFNLPASLIRPVSRLSLPGGNLRAKDVSLTGEKLGKLGWNPTPLKEALERSAREWPSQFNT